VKKLVSVLLTLAVVLGLSLVPVVTSAAEPYDAELALVHKNTSTWEILSNGSGLLEYNVSGSEFEYRFTATGLTPDTEYNLIYYADKPDRFVDWGGDNPGALIATFTTDGSGDIAATASSVELDMDLPCPPDANIDEYDYSGPPDNYTHANGAKIWLVPSTCYDEPEVTSWAAPASYLFETDLIWYDDTDVVGTSVVMTTHTNDITAISVEPGSIAFGSVDPGDVVSGDNITVENIGGVTVSVDVNLDPLTGTVFNYLKLKGVYSPGYSGTWSPIISSLLPNGDRVLTTQLVVPETYSGKGTETATLIFEATAA